MRKDMFKVIVERSRTGGRYQKNGRPPRDLEDLPKKEGIRKPHRDRKSLNENLNPLKRFLEKNVNRPWDKVYSEICENLKPNSTVQDHVRVHVKQYVETHVYKDSGKVYHKGRYGFRYGRVELLNRDLYVDSDTGILRIYRRKT